MVPGKASRPHRTSTARLSRFDSGLKSPHTLNRGILFGEMLFVQELIRPFVRAWEYVGNVGGFPGQLFFVVVVVMVIIGGLTWYSNKK